MRGNASTRLSITGQSADDAIRFSGERGKIDVEPNEMKKIEMTLVARRRPFIGDKQEHNFTTNVPRPKWQCAKSGRWFLKHLL